MFVRAACVTAVVLAAVPGAGCELLGPEACTGAGCISGLRVEIVGEPEYPFTLTVESNSGESRSLECSSAGCRLFFEDFAPAQVTMTYESSTRMAVADGAPDYRFTYPNGKECGPECVNGAINFDIER